MTIAAVSHVASHGAASQVLPQGSDKDQQILLMLILAGVIIFIQHDVSGKPQQGTQYAALGVVGFVLLVLAQFWPDIAFTFMLLFLVAVVLNSPNGVPLISSATSSSGGTGSSSDASSSVPPLKDPVVNTRPINVPNAPQSTLRSVGEN